MSELKRLSFFFLSRLKVQFMILESSSSWTRRGEVKQNRKFLLARRKHIGSGNSKRRSTIFNLFYLQPNLTSDGFDV